MNTGPLWRIPLLSFMATGAVGPLVGAAEAMFDIVSETLRNKVRAYSSNQAQLQMSTRVRLAQIALRLKTLVAYYENTTINIEETIYSGGQLDRLTRVEIRAGLSQVAAEMHKLVNELAKEAGSRGTYLASPVQRFQRDVNALATHALFDMDQTGDLYGRLLLGMELPEGAMV